MPDQAVKVAGLSDVQGIREPFVIDKEARTVGDALAIIDGSHWRAGPWALALDAAAIASGHVTPPLSGE